MTKGLFTFPAKSFFVFAHNQPILSDKIKAHPLIQFLKGIKNKDQLLNTGKHELLPNAREVRFTPESRLDIDMVEFSHTFYTEAFKNPKNLIS